MREGGDPASRREAVQPSLWDRLEDDLPGLRAETDALRSALGEEIGAERVDRLLAGGAREVEREPSLGEAARARLHRLVSQAAQRRRIEEAGIVVTPERLREAVRRDIEVLFNTGRLGADLLLTDAERRAHETPAEQLADFPHVRSCVLNYGVPSFAGRTASDFDREVLARELRDVLEIFEPRLKPGTVRVQVRFGDRAGMRVDVDAVLMMAPVPERLRLSTRIDLDDGRAETQLEAA